MPEFTGRFPWQISVLLTTLVYLAAIAGLWLVPCGVQLLVGFCELSRLVFFVIGALIYLVFLGLTFGQRYLLRRLPPGRARPEFNRRMFFQMLFFCLLASAFYISVLLDRP